MSRMDWKAFLEHEGDEILTSLKKAEDAVARAIRGIWGFIREKIPEFCRYLLAYLHEKCIYVCRIATRVGRLAGFALAWLLIVAGPVAVYPAIITVGWAALALAGSYCGLHRQIGKQRITITEVKGVRNGR